MKFALLISLLLTQTTWEWTDAQGESHYTDDAASIPKGAKRRALNLDPDDAPVVKAAPEPKAASDAGEAPERRDAGPAPAPKPPALPSCAVAEKKVTDLEAAQEKARSDAAKAEEARQQRCQQRVRTHGRAAFATCLMEEKVPAPVDLQPQIEAAREALRRVQQSGCR